MTRHNSSTTLDKKSKSNNHFTRSYLDNNSNTQKGGSGRPMDSITNYRQIIQKSRLQVDSNMVPSSQKNFDDDVVAIPISISSSGDEKLQGNESDSNVASKDHEIVALSRPIGKRQSLQEKSGKTLVISTDGSAVQPNDIVVLDISKTEIGSQKTEPHLKHDEEVVIMRPNLNESTTEEIKALTEEVKNTIQESISSGSLEESFKKLTNQHPVEDNIIVDTSLDSPIQVEEETYSDEEKEKYNIQETQSVDDSYSQERGEQGEQGEQEQEEQENVSENGEEQEEEQEQEEGKDVYEEKDSEPQSETPTNYTSTPSEETSNPVQAKESNQESQIETQIQNPNKELIQKVQTTTYKKGDNLMEDITLKEKFASICDDNKESVAMPSIYEGSYDQTGDTIGKEEMTMQVSIVEQSDDLTDEVLSFDSLRESLANQIHDQSDLNEYSTVRDRLDLQRNIRTSFDNTGSILLYSKIKFKAEPDNVRYIGKVQLEDGGIAHVYSYINVPASDKWGTQRPAFKHYYSQIVEAIKSLIACKVKSVKIPYINAHGFNVLTDEEILAISKVLLSEGIRVHLSDNALELTI